ncbi:hypothetical protein CRG98_003409 [Punica granatum]|uniref:Uncharacterized protein n=1 Tax=Punica granatum TaxID=22663 RepID=A0A2I0L658_PUNGR|nr:hypothetical protein CRG98_003409 [Punica granatum]
MNRAGSDRTGPPEGETARKNAGPDWGSWAWLGLGWACEKKRTWPRPVSRRAAGIGGSGGDEAGGGGSRPWTPRPRPEWAREIALGAVDASPWSIGTSPALNQSESGELSWFSGDGSEFNRFPNSLKREQILRFLSMGLVPPSPNCRSL